jgi:hypothetical protein
MAAMSTILASYDPAKGKYTYTGHTALNPKQVLQKRTEAIGSSIMQEDSLSVISGCVDADGDVLPNRVFFTVTVRRPVTRADDTEVDAALAVFRDIVAGDEFANVVATQEPIT